MIRVKAKVNNRLPSGPYYGPETVTWTTVDLNMDHSNSGCKNVAMSTRISKYGS